MNIKIKENMEQTHFLLQTINTIDSIEFSEWTKEKANLRYNGQMPKFPIYNNFIYWCNLGINIGSEQNKLRPVLISRTANHSPTCTILPLTSQRIHDNFLFHIDLDEINSTVLAEQLRVVSKLRMVQPFRKKGKLVSISQNDWNKINSQLEKLYRLRPLKNN